MYEAAPVVFSNDLRPSHPDIPFAIPKSKALSYTYDRTASDEQIIRGLIAARAESIESCRFDLVKTGEVFNIIPVRARTRREQLASCTAISNTEINLTFSETSLLDAVDQLCTALVRVYPKYTFHRGSVPRIAFENSSITTSSTLASVRDVLNEILSVFHQRYANDPFAQTSIRFTWNIIFAPPATDGTIKPRYNIGFHRILPKSSGHMKLLISNRRPVLHAATALAKRFEIVVNYEDPPYLCRCELIGNDSYKEVSGGVIDMDWQLGDSPERALTALVATAIIPMLDPDVFGLRERLGQYFVYPELSKDIEGNLMLRVPVMDQVISLNIANKNGMEFLESFCQALSQTSPFPVTLGDFPPTLQEKLHQASKPITSITNQNAADALSDYLKSANVQVFSRLLFHPNLNCYQLHLE